MTNTLVILSVVQGILLPIVVSFLKGQQWSSNIKFLFSIGVSIVVSAVTLLVQNDFDWGVLIASAATVWSSAQVVYTTWFRNTIAEPALASMLPWSKDGE